MKIGQGSCINTKNAVAVFKAKPVKTIRPVLKQLDTVLGEINFAAAGAQTDFLSSAVRHFSLDWSDHWEGRTEETFHCET